MNERPVDPGLQCQDQWIRVGFGSAVAFAVALALVSILAMRAVVRSLSDVAFEDTINLIAMQKLRIAEEVKGRKARSFLVTGTRSSCPACTRGTGKLPASSPNCEN
jgi:hypothetical protein